MTGGVRLAEGALGVGLLLLPAPLAMATGAAPAAWALCGLLGAVVGYVVITGVRPLPAGSPVVRSWYCAGTAVGQGFICWTAAAFLGGALGFDRRAVWVSATALVVVCAVAAVNWQPGPVFRRARLGATIALAACWAAWPGSLAPAADATGPVPPGVAAAVFLLLISAVGWESARDVVRSGREVVVAAAIVLAVTVGVTSWGSASRGWAAGGEVAGGGAHVVPSVLVVLVAASYCVTNLRFAGGLVTRRWTGVGSVALVSAVAMAVAFATGGGTWQLLMGPGSATWAIFALYAVRVSTDRAAPTRGRVAAVVAVGLLGWLAATPLWPALLFPAVVGSAALIRARVRTPAPSPG
ncbi:hypothetical protein ACIQMJ_09690 [Actinosynnema sp. NPDC091369]